MAEDTDHGDNPFVVSLKPPKNETPTERATREAHEDEAKRRSDEIDQELRTERENLRRTRRNELKAVFIGDSESGRLDMVKHLRMRFAQEEWDEERVKWRSVIQLKILKAVMATLDALQAELDGEARVESPPDDTHSNVVTEYPLNMPSCGDTAPSARLESSSSGSNDADIPAGNDGSIQDKHLRLLMRLSPIRHAGEKLRRWLATSIEANSPCHAAKESEEATVLIACCKEDITMLWTDETVKSVLRKWKTELEESAQLYVSSSDIDFLPDAANMSLLIGESHSLLEDLDRIASRGYVPSDEDVARVHIRTGIQEYRIKLERTLTGRTSGEDMCLYDIASWRTVRSTWMPYFEGVDAVVFFASISGFDEYLPEDPRVNRLEHSLLLWREICKSRFFNESGLVLFLTKCNLLQRKLARGVKVKDYLPSYGDRDNDFRTVSKYIRDKFRDIAKVAVLRDIILRKNLKTAPLI
ncbi:hypothetical protein EST38_g10136 [Candolleomyces aberdarensis]|uniref:G-alpha-domain-containing protein n=1 Tax=Candolleomyces aberdarensis TaxID=2316362 RepID=A0A4Q2D9W6_9AGAR|nr:hypothetical protein EST38_g10136 [Candolleomyces aberdarensis]